MESIWSAILFNILFSIIFYAIFGYLGIYFSNKIEFLKKFNNKKNLISLSAIFFLYIAIFFKLVVDPEKELFSHMVGSLGNYASLFLGSVLIILIRTKFKKIFNEEFYFALFGGIIFGTLVLTLIYSIDPSTYFDIPLPE